MHGSRCTLSANTEIGQCGEEREDQAGHPPRTPQTNVVSNSLCMQHRAASYFHRLSGLVTRTLQRTCASAQGRWLLVAFPPAVVLRSFLRARSEATTCNSRDDRDRGSTASMTTGNRSKYEQQRSVQNSFRWDCLEQRLTTSVQQLPLHARGRVLVGLGQG